MAGPSSATNIQRRRLLGRLFPNGAAQLWCPLLAHFADCQTLAPARFAHHLRHLAPHIGGILVPGSTGEGWEMTDAEILDLLQVVLPIANEHGIPSLIGVLKQTEQEMLDGIESTCQWMQQRTGAAAPDAAMEQLGVVGFTVCPPTGAHLSQQDIAATLRAVLGCELPIALYQLPQVTNNEMHPTTVAALAAEYPNLIMFKDTSGEDRVALSAVSLDDVILVRGAEGAYAQWTARPSGPYDGFLLSTANVFAAELSSILRCVGAGRLDDAEALAQRVEHVVTRMFQLVADYQGGNPFTNANKILDHVMAFGPDVADQDLPRLRSGERLPSQWIGAAIDLLRGVDLMPKCGYI